MRAHSFHLHSELLPLSLESRAVTEHHYGRISIFHAMTGYRSCMPALWSITQKVVLNRYFLHFRRRWMQLISWWCIGKLPFLQYWNERISETPRLTDARAHAANITSTLCAILYWYAFLSVSSLLSEPGAEDVAVLFLASRRFFRFAHSSWGRYQAIAWRSFFVARRHRQSQNNGACDHIYQCPLIFCFEIASS